MVEPSTDSRDAEHAALVAAVRATGRYFDALLAWTERSPELPDVVAIPAGSEPKLDLLCEEAIDAVKAALVAIGDRR